MKRIFAAVKIVPQPALTRFIDELQQHLADSSIRWVDPKNLHLTLKFFGETPEEKITAIEEALEKIHLAPFDFGLGNLKIFGSRYHPRVLFVEALKAESFKLLSDLIHDQIKLLGYETDRQNFVPHLTLGRIKKISDLKYFQKKISEYSEIVLQTQHVKEFLLYESILPFSGPEYKIMKIFPLGI
ncbi:MAG TPA: RNA 2',3'-cyclic phosphodiesterase [Bacteroidales bacterium]|nr:RNA 2',3'-cyclic phosphodiesterase [Bacteroidales bacterium]